MASRSEPSPQFSSLELSGTSCAMGGSEEWDFVTAVASEADLAIKSSPVVSAWDESMMEGRKSREGSPGAKSVEERMEQFVADGSVRAESDCNEGEEVATSLRWSSAVEEQIEASKVHWSELAKSDSMEGEEVAEESNWEEFKALQWHPIWGGFFQTFGYDLEGGVYERQGELVMGEKFAEGGQAELYDAQVHWWDPEENKRKGREFVLKVFKKGTFLKELKSQLPHGLLQVHVQQMEQLKSGTSKVQPRFYCHVHRGTLLKDGRFAFLMVKEHVDLRNFIDRNMKLRRGQAGGPFSKEDTELIMYRVALGLDWLHNHDIVHRDLKASNVLVREDEGYYPECFIADYECSVGVVGTGFFRAPEILQVCKDRNWEERQEVFSRAADIYSYGMVCYEVLVGKLPFEDHPVNDNRILMDLVINQHLRPEVPEYVEDWAHELLTMCWQSNPGARPRVGEILDIISRNSAAVRKFEEFLMKRYGRILRSSLKHDAEIMR